MSTDSGLSPLRNVLMKSLAIVLFALTALLVFGALSAFFSGMSGLVPAAINAAIAVFFFRAGRYAWTAAQYTSDAQRERIDGVYQRALREIYEKEALSKYGTGTPAPYTDKNAAELMRIHAYLDRKQAPERFAALMQAIKAQVEVSPA